MMKQGPQSLDEGVQPLISFLYAGRQIHAYICSVALYTAADEQSVAECVADEQSVW